MFSLLEDQFTRNSKIQLPGGPRGLLRTRTWLCYAPENVAGGRGSGPGPRWGIPERLRGSGADVQTWHAAAQQVPVVKEEA